MYRFLAQILLFSSLLPIAAAGQIYVDSAGFHRTAVAPQTACSLTPTESKLLKLSKDGSTVLGELKISKTLKSIAKQLKGQIKTRTSLKKKVTSTPPGAQKKKLKAQLKKLKLKISKNYSRRSFIKQCRDRLLPHLDFSIAYNQQGVPIITASSDRAAMFGLGMAHASLRLLQMDLQRKKMQGRLAEFLGPIHGTGDTLIDLVRHDKNIRTLGFYLQAQKIYPELPSEIQQFLQAFSDGVNYYVTKELNNQLPEGFETAHITTFEPWQPADSLLAYMTLTHQFTGGYGGEIEARDNFQEDVDEIGYDQALEKWLNPIIDADAAIIPPTFFASLFGEANSLQAHIPPNIKASENWVVDGQHNETGKPILVGLPKLGLDSRAFIETHIISPTMNARGAGFPGCPGNLIGFTPNISWSVTSLTSDAADLFALKPDPTNPENRYLLDGTSLRYRERDEIIKVYGADPETIQVKSSYFGPVIDTTLATDDAGIYALRHVILSDIQEDHRLHPIQGLIGMMRAQTMAQFENEGLRYLTYPSVHMLFASNEGTFGRIGYRPSIALPIRSSNSPLKGIIPQDGSSIANDWQGFYTIDQTPSLHDPDQGFIGTANNLPTASSAIYGYGGVGHSTRSWTIDNYLRNAIAQNGVLTKEQIIGLKNTCYNDSLLAIRELMNYLIAQYPTLIPNNPGIASAIAHYNAWGGEFITSDPNWPLVGYIANIASTYFRPTPMARTKYNGGEGGLVYFLRTFRESPDQAVEPQFLNAIIQWLFNRVLADAWVYTNNPPDHPFYPGYGSDPGQWLQYLNKKVTINWGVFHTLSDSLDDSYQIQSNDLECPSTGTMRGQAGNIYTLVSVLAEPNETKTLMAPGNDENPFSPSFSNHLSAWEASVPEQANIDASTILAQCTNVASAGKICSDKKLTIATVD